jgi:O-acetyl-ADP-ribose deacetylase
MLPRGPARRVPRWTRAGVSAMMAAMPATVRAVVGDLTRQEVDAVVNAANEHLQHGGGVAAALARGGGPVVQEASDAWVDEHGPLEPGTAAVTPAGDLPARWLVHVVGPRYRRRQDNEGLLRQAVAAALDAAADLGARSVALPAISAGIFGYPPAEAGRVIAEEASRWAAAHGGSVAEVRLVALDDAGAAAFAAGLGSDPG